MTEKVLLIGLDAAIPTIVQKYFNMNKLPNMKMLVAEGTWAEGIPVFPTHTASNWTSISTGAWPATHGVTDMAMHLPGTPLTEIKSGFYSNLCLAEQIWLTCERFDKKSILLKYIGSWPPNIKNSIQIEGFGAPGGPSARPWGSSPLALSNSLCYSTTPLENAIITNFHEANLSNWKHVSNGITFPPQESYLPIMETEIKIGPLNSNLSYNLLLLACSSHDKYDTVLITKNRGSDGFLLKDGQLSPWLTEAFEIDGKVTDGSYRMKLVHIGVDDDNNIKFRLFVSQIYPLEGWTFPSSIAKELTERFGPFLESISHFPYVFGWIDEDTYLDDVRYQAKWMGNVTKYLISKYPWDLYMTQWHGIDNIQHAFLRFDKSVLTKSESELCDKLVLSSYEIADDLVGDIVESTKKAKKEYSDDVYTFVLSDHGHVMGKRRFFINGYLYQKGLIKLKRDEVTRKINIDWKNTYAFAQGMVHVYVNLKGRDPDGAVQPGKEYEDMVNELIELLYDIKDPITGIRPVSLALSNKDAEFLGLSGERAGDVILAANSVYVFDNRVKTNDPMFEDVKVAFPDGSIHGAQLPSVDLGEHGTIKSMFIAHGPNIKKGYVRKKPIKVVDIAPTISYILNIPAPKDSEGSVMYDLFQ